MNDSGSRNRKCVAKFSAAILHKYISFGFQLFPSDLCRKSQNLWAFNMERNYIINQLIFQMNKWKSSYTVNSLQTSSPTPSPIICSPYFFRSILWFHFGCFCLLFPLCVIFIFVLHAAYNNLAVMIQVHKKNHETYVLSKRKSAKNIIKHFARCF